MNFYEATIKIKVPDLQESGCVISLNPRTRERFRDMNGSLGVKCDIREALNVFLCDINQGSFQVIFSIDQDKGDLCLAKSFLCDFFEKHYNGNCAEVSDITEITAHQFHQLGMRAENNGLVRRFRNYEAQMGTDYPDNGMFQLSENLLEDKYRYLIQKPTESDTDGAMLRMKNCPIGANRYVFVRHQHTLNTWRGVFEPSDQAYKVASVGGCTDWFRMFIRRKQ